MSGLLGLAAKALLAKKRAKATAVAKPVVTPPAKGLRRQGRAPRGGVYKDINAEAPPMQADRRLRTPRQPAPPSMVGGTKGSGTVPRPSDVMGGTVTAAGAAATMSALGGATRRKYMLGKK